MIPGKVQNLTIANNTDANDHSGRKVVITFDDPANVQNASNDNDKSIQYEIQSCVYNDLIGEASNCEMLTVLLRNTSTHQQSTKNGNANGLFSSSFDPATNMEMEFRVTAVSLNGTKGEVEKKVVRLDPSTSKF